MPNPAALWQLASDFLFVAGALGAMFVEVRIHRTLIRPDGSMATTPSRKDLHALIVVCLLCTLLIAAAMLLPIAAGLNQPGGMSTLKRLGPDTGRWLVAAWIVNACFCAWTVLRRTRGMFSDRLRYGASATIALTSVTAGLHNYCWMLNPAALPRFISPYSAVSILAATGLACLLSLRLLANSADEGPLFDWDRIRVRVFGWLVLFLNGMVFLLWHVRALPFTRQFLPGGLDMALPFLVNAGLVVPYLQLKDTTSGSRKMTNLMLLFLAMQLAVLWVLTSLPASRS